MSDTDEDANPAGIQGIEFVEYLSRQPDTLGQALERLGFRPIARHRSRAVRLYRQGTMNVIVNADADTLALIRVRWTGAWTSSASAASRWSCSPTSTPTTSTACRVSSTAGASTRCG